MNSPLSDISSLLQTYSGGQVDGISHKIWEDKWRYRETAARDQTGAAYGGSLLRTCGIRSQLVAEDATVLLGALSVLGFMTQYVSTPPSSFIGL